MWLGEHIRVRRSNFIDNFNRLIDVIIIVNAVIHIHAAQAQGCEVLDRGTPSLTICNNNFYIINSCEVRCEDIDVINNTFIAGDFDIITELISCLLYTSPSPRDS